ncbi:unnamed protein product [[Candida] boidinii]|uniref:Unnamed protein product n=1 Tax=Candida boidinii TaxID=5477 RepID=A0ACB5TGX9_CANBO|nr:unnamed protein product [[Candida] boidinii]
MFLQLLKLLLFIPINFIHLLNLKFKNLTNCNIKFSILIPWILIWLFSFNFFLKIIPNYYSSNCSWNNHYKNIDAPILDNNLKNFNKFNDDYNPYHILLIADPQLIDSHTYPGRNKLLLKLSEHVVDNYIDRNFKSLSKTLNPDSIIFLGDYLDNGRSSDDGYFLTQLDRFNNIFKKYSKNTTELIFNVPGNHDIGFGDDVKINSRTRFTRLFNAEPNSIIERNNNELIFLDSISLNSYNNDNISLKSKLFLEKISNKEKSKTRILFHHVPLYRDKDLNKCGDLREDQSKPFPIVKGYQYQTIIDASISEKILNGIKPDLIFSGDDHDYCEVFHRYGDNGENRIAPEVTVKSISMAMGIKRPAVQLLTLFNKKTDHIKIHDWSDETIINETSFNYNICYLPIPYHDSFIYGSLAILNLFFLFVYSILRVNSSGNISISNSNSSSNSNSPISSSSTSTTTTSSPVSLPSSYKKLDNTLEIDMDDLSGNATIPAITNNNNIDEFPIESNSISILQRMNIISFLIIGFTEFFIVLFIYCLSIYFN